MKPAVAKSGSVRSVVLVVTFQHVLAPQHNLAQLTVRHFAIFFVDDAHLVADRQSARTGTSTLTGRIDRGTASRLRQTVTFDHETVERLFETSKTSAGTGAEPHIAKRNCSVFSPGGTPS